MVFFLTFAVIKHFLLLQDKSKIFSLLFFTYETVLQASYKSLYVVPRAQGRWLDKLRNLILFCDIR